MSKSLKIAFIALSLMLILGFALRGRITHVKFNSEKWKTTNLNLEENFSLRWDMMNSLRKEHDLVGKTNKEIQKILGKPDDSWDKEISYYLGYTGTGIYTGTLHIKFDSRKIVTEIKVSQG